MTAAMVTGAGPIMAVLANKYSRTNTAGREMIQSLEHRIATELPQADLKVKHGFAPGVYARKLYVPKGTILTGKVHKFAHWNVLLKGHIEVMTEHGVKHVRAGDMFVSPAGTKRAGFAHEDSVWVTMHPTNETDVAKIEADVVVDTFEEFDGQYSIEGKVIE
jgi:quercetin dioxygenase-like cupin family protein